ncbi:ribosome small subunit-dependent GTPase A [Georgenia wangjunii]|uniref:ribosome small subunit-dependent GTPase A n=1 Tax=Georgenia wangjunii TaxID=3117730 RepID=UPI002F266549
MTPQHRDTGTDDDRVRLRPARRGTPPRTKVRPEHADAVPAMVLGVDRGRYALLADDGTHLVAMKARELGRGARTAVVVGDRVGVVGDTSGRKDTLARIVRVEERATALRRSGEDGESTGVERVIVANADQLLIVTALAEPEPRPRMVDRCLVAAYDAGMEPVLCLTKADLADPGPFLAQYAALEVPAIVTSVAGGEVTGLDAVRERLTGRTSVLVGHSGVGKSTLINALVPDAQRATGGVNAVTGRGRHTSSSAVALALPDGGWAIDTPGVRSFGLSHVGPDDLLRAFGDLAAVAQECPRGCTHGERAPDCALDAWVASGAAGPAGQARLESFRRLLAARTGGADPAGFADES